MSQNQGRHFTEQLQFMLDLSRPLCQLEKIIQWQEIDQIFHATSEAETGRPLLSSRLVAGLLFIKHVYNYSDETLIEMLPENPYDPYFCGFEYFQTKPRIDPSSLSRWRKRLGESGMEELLKISISVGLDARLIKKKTWKESMSTLQSRKRILHSQPTLSS